MYTKCNIPVQVVFLTCHCVGLLQQIRLKNHQLKDIIDQLRTIIWEINTMMVMRKWCSRVTCVASLEQLCWRETFSGIHVIVMFASCIDSIAAAFWLVQVRDTMGPFHTNPSLNKFCYIIIVTFTLCNATGCSQHLTCYAFRPNRERSVNWECRVTQLAVFIH